MRAHSSPQKFIAPTMPPFTHVPLVLSLHTHTHTHNLHERHTITAPNSSANVPVDRSRSSIKLVSRPSSPSVLVGRYKHTKTPTHTVAISGQQPENHTLAAFPLLHTRALSENHCFKQSVSLELARLLLPYITHRSFARVLQQFYD